MMHQRRALKDRNLPALLILLLFSFGALAQGPVQELKSNTLFDVVGGKKGLLLPKDTTVRVRDSAFTHVAFKEGKLYVFDTAHFHSKKWQVYSSGGTTITDSTILDAGFGVDMYKQLVGSDSVVFIEADTSLMATRNWVNQSIAGLSGGGAATSLNGLTDVTISSPASGQVLRYDGTEWKNQAAAVIDQSTFRDSAIARWDSAGNKYVGQRFAYTDLNGIAPGDLLIWNGWRFVKFTPSYAPSTGSTNYIQNGTALQASCNFRISGTGAANYFHARAAAAGDVPGLYFYDHLNALRGEIHYQPNNSKMKFQLYNGADNFDFAVGGSAKFLLNSSYADWTVTHRLFSAPPTYTSGGFGLLGRNSGNSEMQIIRLDTTLNRYWNSFTGGASKYFGYNSSNTLGFHDLPSGGSSASAPLNEIIRGTGSGITSSSNLTYDGTDLSLLNGEIVVSPDKGIRTTEGSSGGFVIRGGTSPILRMINANLGGSFGTTSFFQAGNRSMMFSGTAGEMLTRLGFHSSGTVFAGTGDYNFALPDPLGVVHIQSYNTSRNLLYLKSVSGITADHVNIVNSSDVSLFKVDNVGDVTINALAGTANRIAFLNSDGTLQRSDVDPNRLHLSISNEYTDVSNVGTGEDVLSAIPAPALSADGDQYEAEAALLTAANANSKTIKFYIGSTAILTIPSATAATGYIIKVRLTRTGSSAQKYQVEVYNSGGGSVAYGTTSVSGTIDLSVTGEAVSNGDITLKSFVVKKNPKQ